MTTTSTESLEFRDNMLRNEWIYPSACGIPPYQDVVYHPYRKSYVVRYNRESRPKPADLLSNMTSRPKATTLVDTRGVSWIETREPCPHSGVHGDIVKRSYITDVSNANTGYLFPDYESLKSRNLWSGPLRDKIGNQQVNLGSSVAEYKESCKMFAGFAKSLWNGYQAIRGKAKRKPITVRDIPAAVLAYNFGIAPLANDVYSSIEMLKHRMEKPAYRRFSGSVFHGRGNTIAIGGNLCKGNGAFRQRATVYVTLSEFATANGDFDFGNPLEWAWELIPFSFVVDWAIPIGEWLGRLDSLIGVTVHSGTVVTKTWTKMKYHKNGATHILSEGTFNDKTYERSVISSIPSPPLPKWEPSLSWRRVINATSLLWLLSGRIRRK